MRGPLLRGFPSKSYESLKLQTLGPFFQTEVLKGDLNAALGSMTIPVVSEDLERQL